MPLAKIPALLTAATLLSGAGFAVVSPAHAAAAPKTYANCTALNKVYKHGVGRKGAVDKTAGKRVTNFTVNTAVYNKNTKSDRDHDGIACEKA
ncbi:excalibur calcium-binding domain-containing protein [Allobranchiibius sp. GilTou38]|uniref:excalibur calcium-binding domain-containing protein n=1 Tax=Allobranchiibius sp. GilTou38 TaxID=2815210 RepID=UPI001AA12F92|nr:excalibur calcium-binding domain-containing protein [Allobranchiibius sp. GilTou38]MBO1767927.1 excalibur calcium-binding domain-containing protein [Allobranchiibius sp. GilTou38]